MFPLLLEWYFFLFANVYPVSLKTKLSGRIVFPQSGEHPLKHIWMFSCLETVIHNQLHSAVTFIYWQVNKTDLFAMYELGSSSNACFNTGILVIPVGVGSEKWLQRSTRDIFWSGGGMLKLDCCTYFSSKFAYRCWLLHLIWVNSTVANHTPIKLSRALLIYTY